MPNKTFLRREATRHSRLGKKRKKLQKWRRPKGRDNKMRLSRKGYPASPSLGYASPKADAGKVEGKFPVLIFNITDLSKVDKTQIAILAKVGAKKKLEIIKYADEKKIKILNVGGKNEAGK